MTYKLKHIKNQQLWTAIRALGFSTAFAFSQASGLHFSSLLGFLHLTRSPLRKKGAWSVLALDTAKAVSRFPEDIFPPEYLRRIRRIPSQAEVELMWEIQRPLDPEQEMIAAQERMTLDRLLQKLSPRSERVIRLRLGFAGEPQTLEQVGQMFGGLGRERIRQIEKAAYRRLSHRRYAPLWADTCRLVPDKFDPLRFYPQRIERAEQLRDELREREIIARAQKHAERVAATVLVEQHDLRKSKRRLEEWSRLRELSAQAIERVNNKIEESAAVPLPDHATIERIKDQIISCMARALPRVWYIDDFVRALGVPRAYVDKACRELVHNNQIRATTKS